MKFDDIIVQLGEFGPYQKRVYFLSCLVAIPAAMQTLSVVFTLYTPGHRCAIPGLPNDTYKVQGPWHQALINESVPCENDDEQYSKCRLYNTVPNATDHFTNKTHQCSKWVYSEKYFDSTVTGDLNLVCDDKSLSTYANMIFMTGSLIGGLLSGMVSDRIGRKKVLLSTMIGSAISYFGMTFVKNYILFAILRFVTAVVGAGQFLTSFVIGMELVGPGRRVTAAVFTHAFWTLGLFIMTIEAFFIRDWQYLQIATSIPGILLFSLVFVIPESARWLISKGRYEEASKILHKAAEVNDVTLSKDMLQFDKIEEVSQEKISTIFKTPRLLFLSLILFFNWMVTSMVYYGLSLNVNSLSGDIYLNFSLSALVELGASFFCLFMLDRMGRTPLQAFSLILAGLACLGTIFPVVFGTDDVNWITLSLSLIGKFGGSSGFHVIYIMSAEFFPTTVRNSGMGFGYFSSRIGGIIAPFIADIRKVITSDLGEALPLMMFGAISLLAGLLALMIPETLGKKLPETVEDAKAFGRETKKKGPSIREMSTDPKHGKDQNNGEVNGGFVPGI